MKMRRNSSDSFSPILPRSNITEGESFAAFTARVQGALDQLLITHDSGDVALIAHGGVCRAIVGSVLGVPMHNWLRLAQAYGCLNVIEWHDGSPVLVLFNR